MAILYFSIVFTKIMEYTITGMKNFHFGSYF